MPLDPAKIREIYAKKETKAKRRSNKVTGLKGKKVDVNDRSYQAWFALNHMLIDHETNEMLFCDNPDCIDPRDKVYGQTVVDINGSKICRFCFVEGWLLKNPAQESLEDE